VGAAGAAGVTVVRRLSATVLTAVLAAGLAVVGVAAVRRPYADLQRNALAAAAVVLALALLAVVLRRVLRAAARAIADEWRPRR